MSSGKTVPFYEMFPFCRDNGISGFGGVSVESAVVEKASKTMNLRLLMSEVVSPVELKMAENAIAIEFGLAGVTITAQNPKTVVKPTAKSKGAKKQNAGTVLLGRTIKESPTPMSAVELELGKVTVTGEVCDVSSRHIERRNAWVLSFDITDFTGTIHVSKFMTEENAAKIVTSIKEGMYLTVSGNLNINRYDGDLALEPVNIVVTGKQTRQDTAPDKRVELHLHTKMSAMDALTDTKEVVRRAIEWGHPAIAITDHGVVHSFPDAMSAAKGDIKVIYGLEGYFYNDTDNRQANYCEASGTPDSEFVVFDIETTGLSAVDDAIIELGAVKIRNGVEAQRFNTFVNPIRPVPFKITTLTGITDSDVLGAPGIIEALESFIDFAGNAPLVAHNANFDVGFICEACERCGIEYNPRYIDTLAMARALLPELKNHKLDTVAAYFNKSDFNHHRASDDALVTAHIFIKLAKMLEAEGMANVSEMNSVITRLYSERGSVKKSRRSYNHIILLAKNQTGIKNLYKLVTKSHLEDFNRYPVIFKSALIEHREGLIVGSACEAGEVFSQIADGGGSIKLRRTASFYDYLEIQPICNNMFMLSGSNPRASSEEQLREFNRRVIKLGKELGKPVVATGDTHFLDPEHEIYRHILLASKEFDNADDDLPIYFKTTDEMLEEFSYLGEETAYEVVVKNTQAIADMCETVSPLPPAKTLFAPKLEGSAEDLKSLVYGKLEALYGDNPPNIVTERVEMELNDILERNYDVIYMTAQKLVADSLSNGYLVGSRGSVGSSIVAYLAGITEVNSLPAHYRCPECKRCDFESGAEYGCGADMPDGVCPDCGAEYAKEGFNIPFETFLGFGGDKVPDIDLNFSGEYQAKAHKYTNELFGASKVFRAGTIGTIAEKTAYGYVKKYLERVNRRVTRAEENRLARGCVGVKRTTGQHPGGLIVIPQDMEITDFCPAQHPADSKDGGIITTHFDYHCMEDNLLKLDELGHDDPTMIKMLEDLTGVDAKQIKLDDTQTMAIFKSPAPLGLDEGDEIIGQTGSIGIPEFGTGFTRQMLCDTKPENFDTLVRLSGFSHGTNVWLGNAKDLIQSGTATVTETIGCRDDIMLYLISKGLDARYAFKISESVRKGRGLPDGAAEEMTRVNVPGWYIESCQKIEYLFPKAHAVAYVMMAFRIAWFKVHHPLAFYSAYFYRRSQKDSFDAELMTQGLSTVQAKIREIKNATDKKAKDEDLLTTLEACYEYYMRGFTFAGVDIYDSDPVKFLVTDEKTLRAPLVAVSGLGETAARDIAENRSRRFISIDDFSGSCAKVSKAHIEQLRNLGALRNMPQNSQLSLF